MELTVYEASIKRLEYIYAHFENVIVSFSGGKDSGVLLNLAIDVARIYNKRLTVVYLDFEVMYSDTIEFVQHFANMPDLDFYWVCLPFTFDVGATTKQSTWTCWGKNESWFRDIPGNAYRLDNHPFDFYKNGMADDTFLSKFGQWISRKNNNALTASLIGIRTDESLNRWRAMNRPKSMFNGKIWTTKINSRYYNAYPIYDWGYEDIWIYNSRFSKPYNRVYDKMYMLGTKFSRQRICEPFGRQQKAGLWQWQYIEPGTWNKVLKRVQGVQEWLNERDNLGKLPDGISCEVYFNELLQKYPVEISEPISSKLNKIQEKYNILGENERTELYRLASLAIVKNDPSYLSISKLKKNLAHTQSVINKWENL